MVKLIFSLLITFILSGQSNGQIIQNVIDFRFDSLDFKNIPVKQYGIKPYESTLRYVYEDIATGKVLADFLRIDDSTYYYTSYSATGDILSEGSASVAEAPYDVFRMSSDRRSGKSGYSEKVSYYRLIKTNFWTYYTKDSMLETGKYINNKKEGCWFFFKNKNRADCDYRFYINNELIDIKSPNTLEESSDEVLRVLDGYWNLGGRRESSIIPDSLIFYYKTPAGENPGRHYIHFTKDGKWETLSRGIESATRVSGNWAFDSSEKKIALSKSDGSHVLNIYWLSGNQFICVF